MTALQPSLVPAEQDVRALVADICLALLGRHTQPANLPLHGPLPLHWTACVGIGGGWCGIVTVACPMELARRGAARILGVTPALVDDSAAQDLLAELANILGGNLKGIMASALGQPCHLALPVVAPGIRCSPAHGACASSALSVTKRCLRSACWKPRRRKRRHCGRRTQEDRPPGAVRGSGSREHPGGMC